MRASSRAGSAHLVLADFDEAKLGAVVDEFTARRLHRHRSAGRRVRPCVGRCIGRGGSVGSDRCVRSCTPPASHPRRRPARACSEVDMLGTEHVLNAFLDVVVQGTVAVCIASMAGSMAELPPRARARGDPATDRRAHGRARRHGLERLRRDLQRRQARQPAPDRAGGGGVGTSGGGRVVSISPGIISTPMGAPGARRGRRRADAGDARHLAGATHRHRRGHRLRGAVAGQPGGVVRQRLRPPRRRRGHRRRPRVPSAAG